MRRNKARPPHPDDIKRARRLPISRLHFLHARREKAREEENEKARREKSAIENRKQKSDREGRGSAIYDRCDREGIDAREARRAKGGLSVFRVGTGKIFAYTPRSPLPSTSRSSYIGRVIPRYRLRRLHIPKFRQPKRL